MKTTKKLKTITLSLGLAALMFQAVTVDAQVINRGLLQNPYKEQGKQDGALMRSGLSSTYNISTGQFGGNGGQAGGNYGISIGTMGQEPTQPAPLGSGLFIMAAAGAAYAFSKKRKNQENN
jgi:hypothetical protein